MRKEISGIMLSMGAGLHQRYTYLVCGQLIYARDGKPEREGTILPTVGGAGVVQLDVAGSRTRSDDYFSPLLGLRELAVEGLHVQSQGPLVDVLLLGVRVLQHAPVVLQQTVV